jgi:hypothetical protein
VESYTHLRLVRESYDRPLTLLDEASAHPASRGLR